MVKIPSHVASFCRLTAFILNLNEVEWLQSILDFYFKFIFTTPKAKFELPKIK